MRVLLTFAVLWLADVAALSAQQPALPPSNLAVDIQTLVDQQTSLLLRKDAAALASLFTQDAVYVGASGEMHAGQASIRDYYTKTFATLDYARAAGLVGEFTREARVYQVHALGEGAWAFGRGNLLVNAPIGVVGRTDHWMAVFAKVGGEWKIRMMSVGEDVQPPPLRER
jgi:ketosteroid isomerase-like protein